MNRLLLAWVDTALALQEENERWRDTCTALLFALAEHCERCELARAELERQEERAA